MAWATGRWVRRSPGAGGPVESCQACWDTAHTSLGQLFQRPLKHMLSKQHRAGSSLWRCAAEAFLLAFHGLCVMDLLIHLGQGHRPPRAILNQQSLGSRQRGSKPEMSKLEVKYQVHVLQHWILKNQKARWTSWENYLDRPRAAQTSDDHTKFTEVGLIFTFGWCTTPK